MELTNSLAYYEKLISQKVELILLIFASKIISLLQWPSLPKTSKYKFTSNITIWMTCECSRRVLKPKLDLKTDVGVEERG
jgi:hypothetical protein